MRPEYNAVHGQLEPNSSAPSCVVTKNSILLVEYAIVARREGKSRFEALIDACHKRSRPIAMTTIAMGAGMLPLALGYGAAPMAIAVLGGLMTSKLLSLLVVPAVFTYVDDAKEWLTRVFQGACAFQLANALRCG